MGNYLVIVLLTKKTVRVSMYIHIYVNYACNCTNKWWSCKIRSLFLPEFKTGRNASCSMIIANNVCNTGTFLGGTGRARSRTCAAESFVTISRSVSYCGRPDGQRRDNCPRLLRLCRLAVGRYITQNRPSTHIIDFCYGKQVKMVVCSLAFLYHGLDRLLQCYTHPKATLRVQRMCNVISK